MSGKRIPIGPDGAGSPPPGIIQYTIEHVAEPGDTIEVFSWNAQTYSENLVITKTLALSDTMRSCRRTMGDR
jgi:hypothetical protein